MVFRSLTRISRRCDIQDASTFSVQDLQWSYGKTALISGESTFYVQYKLFFTSFVMTVLSIVYFDRDDMPNYYPIIGGC